MLIIGSDLRGVKDLIQKHAVIEKEMTMFETRITEIVEKAEHMVKNGHFDADSIKKSISNLDER